MITVLCRYRGGGGQVLEKTVWLVDNSTLPGEIMVWGSGRLP